MLSLFEQANNLLAVPPQILVVAFLPLPQNMQQRGQGFRIERDRMGVLRWR